MRAVLNDEMRPGGRRGSTGSPEARRGQAERQEGAWRVLRLEGAFELAYEDAAGTETRRRLVAQELKIGPGRVLLGGIDLERDGYRGFRADRIQRLTDAETQVTVERNIPDWLLKRAERTVGETSARLRRARARSGPSGE